MTRHRMLTVLLPTMTTIFGLVALPAVSVAAPSDVSVQRIFGVDRYATSAAIARDTFGTSATPVGKAVIANGSGFTDAAIGANLLSGYWSPGPVLLTRPHDLPPPVVDVIRQLRVYQFFVVGGTAAVDLAVEGRLQTLGRANGTWGGVYATFRRSDRYATGAAVVRSAFDPEANQLARLDGKNTAFLVSGVSASDAIAAAPLTYAVRKGGVLPLVNGKFPLLLTQPNVLSVATRNVLLSISSGEGRHIEQVIVVGGPGAVSPAVLTQIKALGISTRRIQGVNRQATAVAVAEFAIQTLGWNPAHINLARGDDSADAISAAPHAGEERGPLLFTLSPGQLGTATAGFLRAHAGTISSIDVLGGPGALSDVVVAQARAAARG